MPKINIIVREKIAQAVGDTHIVCGNSDYIVVFDFDEEWVAYDTKTARFIWNGKYTDVVFTGTECPVPVITNAVGVLVGVYAGELHTTTAATVDTEKSILCGQVVEYKGSPLGTNEIIEAIEKANDEQVQSVTQIVDDGYDKILAAIDQAVFDKELLVDILAGTCENLTGDAITSIADYVFYSKSSLKTIDLPNCVLIGNNAFYNCDALTIVNLPMATSIGDSAFYNCDALMTVDIPVAASIDDKSFYQCSALTTVDSPMATSIGSGAFYNCTKLTTVDLPMATSIGSGAFYNCDALTIVNLPMATSIGNAAFRNCTELTTVYLPMATSIESYTLCNCNKLTTVNLPMATSIGNAAFRNCTELTTVDLPMATSIASSAFNGCSALTTVNLPMATSIASNAFIGCYSLTIVNLPMTTSIGNTTFGSCSRLTTVDLPMATSIASNAFINCYSLTALILGGTNVCALASTSAFTKCYHILGTTNSTYNPTGAKDGYIYVPDDLVDSYKSATNWSTYASQIKPLSEYKGEAE